MRISLAQKKSLVTCIVGIYAGKKFSIFTKFKLEVVKQCWCLYYYEAQSKGNKHVNYTS